jgi:hypothetical protein
MQRVQILVLFYSHRALNKGIPKRCREWSKLTWQGSLLRPGGGGFPTGGGVHPMTPECASANPSPSRPSQETPKKVSRIGFVNPLVSWFPTNWGYALSGPSKFKAEGPRGGLCTESHALSNAVESLPRGDSTLHRASPSSAPCTCVKVQGFEIRGLWGS